MTTFEVDGQRFRDLDHDGVLSPYEDWRLPAAERARDLVSRLTLDEKVGLMLHGTIAASGGPMAVLGIGSEYDQVAAEDLIVERGVNCMISRLNLKPSELAEQNNAIQAIAATSRLGIPVTISTDPRHHEFATIGAGVEGGGFSVWPGPLGLAASGSEQLVEQFGDVVRQEYRATGLHTALSPQADLATSPQWSRLNGTFGEDPSLVRMLVGAYVRGIQGGSQGVTATGVAAVVKHWVGYGAAPSGFDGHNYYGRFSAFPGGAFDAHVEAFLDAFDNGVAGVMPTYNILDGQSLNGELIEQVAAGYSRELLTDLLRGTHGFDGLILSDWAITRDVTESTRTGVPPQGPGEIGMAWGVETLTRAERYAKGINAGLDQFGGEDDPAPLLEALNAGWLNEARLDASAHRVLLQKFELGLFDDPFVDPAEADEIVSSAPFERIASAARRRSVVFLKQPTEPVLATSSRVYLEGIEAEALAHPGIGLVDELADADLAVVKLHTPHQLLHPGFFFGARQHEGDLDFKDDGDTVERLRELSSAVPLVVIMEMDRPAVLTNIEGFCSVLAVGFGGADAAVIELLLGHQDEPGRLPIALPRSMDAVRDTMPDAPLDDPDPLYPCGYGLPKLS